MNTNNCYFCPLFFISFSYSIDMRHSTRKRKASAHFEPDTVAVPPQPAVAPQLAPLPQQDPMIPQPVPVPQPAPVLPKPAPTPQPDPMVPLPAAVVQAPVDIEHPQEVLDQGSDEIIESDETVEENELSPLLDASTSPSECYNSDIEILVSEFTEYPQKMKRENAECNKQGFLIDDQIKLKDALQLPVNKPTSSSIHVKVFEKHECKTYKDGKIVCEVVVGDETDCTRLLIYDQHNLQMFRKDGGVIISDFVVKNGYLVVTRMTAVSGAVAVQVPEEVVKKAQNLVGNDLNVLEAACSPENSTADSVAGIIVKARPKEIKRRDSNQEEVSSVPALCTNATSSGIEVLAKTDKCDDPLNLQEDLMEDDRPEIPPVTIAEIGPMTVL